MLTQQPVNLSKIIFMPAYIVTQTNKDDNYLLLCLLQLCRSSSKGGAVAYLSRTGPLTLTFHFSSTLAAHAQRARSPAGNQRRTRKSSTEGWMST